MKTRLLFNRASVACLLGALIGILDFASAIAQPIELFELGAPSAEELGGAGGQGYTIPQGDWTGYQSWLNRSVPPSGPITAFIDSGVITSHPYIRPVLESAIDLTGEGAEDTVGHGTFVALLFLMAGGDSVGPIISIKVYGGNEARPGAGVMARAIRRAAAEGARIVNVSAGVFLECANARDPAPSGGFPCEETPICKAVDEVRASGVLVIAAVGNSPGKTGCPACCQSALAIGAADENGQPAPYSGAFPDFLAPGTFRAIPLNTIEP